MASSKDIAEAKKLSAHIRQFSKKFFEDFYVKATKAGRSPLPIEAMAALGRVLQGATEGEWPSQPLSRPGVSTEVFDSVTSRFPQEAYHEAVEAWYRHTPGLGIKKGKPGRRPNDELAKRIWALKAEGKRNLEIQKIVNASGDSLSLEAVESYLKMRRRARKQ